MIDSKWSILILRELFAYPIRRTHDLQVGLGISPKVLTQRLRELEHHHLISRQIFAEVPPRVEYQLTEKGRELQPVLIALYEVGIQWQSRLPCDCPLIQEKGR